MKCIKKIFLLIISSSVLALMVFLPKYSSRILMGQREIDWLKPKNESYRGVINVWHVMSFKPLKNSLYSFLNETGKQLEKKHFGVYFNVTALTEAEALKKLANGERPHIISYSPSFSFKLDLLPIETGGFELIECLKSEANTACSVCYGCSCTLLMYYPSKIDKQAALNEDNSIDDNAYRDFKGLKTPCCLADAGRVGEMLRLLDAGKAEYFEIIVSDHTKLLQQRIGIVENTDEPIVPYAKEFIERTLSVKRQEELLKLGMLPANKNIELKYEQSFLTDAYKKLLGEHEAQSLTGGN